MTIEEKQYKAKKILSHPFQFSRFVRPYTFTTENITGYIDSFSFPNKSLLTVGSSSDQALNAIQRGCTNITVLDVCPFTKEFFYFKKAALLSLSREEYMDYLGWTPSGAKKSNPKAITFDKAFFEKIKNAIEEEESYFFWTSLMKEYSPDMIRKRFFTSDEMMKNNLPLVNPYLKDDSSYSQTQKTIESVHPTFIEGDIRKQPIPQKYDLILLSNIFDYFNRTEGINTVYKAIDSLTEDGQAMLYYLYAISTWEEEVDMDELYDRNRLIQLLPYGTELLRFPSVFRYEEEKRWPKSQDGALVYQKKRH